MSIPRWKSGAVGAAALCATVVFDGQQHTSAAQAGQPIGSPPATDDTTARPSQLRPSPLDLLRPELGNKSADGPTAKPYDELKVREQLAGLWFDLYLTDLEAFEKLLTELSTSGETTGSGISKIGLIFHYVNRIASEVYYEPDVKHALTRVEQWRAWQPQSIWPHLVKAQIIRNQIFAALRSNFYVDKKTILKLKKQLRETLDTHKATASTSAIWYLLMMDSLSFEPNSDGDIWLVLEEGAKKHPNELWLYSRAATALAGSIPATVLTTEAVAQFARRNANAVHGTGAYARLYSGMSIYHSNQLAVSNVLDREKLRSSANDIVTLFPTQWNIQSLGAMACRLNDRPLARAMFSRMAGPPIPAAWGNLEAMEKCRNSHEPEIRLEPSDKKRQRS